MSDVEPMTKEEAREYYQDRGVEVASVGRYLRISESASSRSCFGPHHKRPTTGWTVVEIDWNRKEFLVAPVNDLVVAGDE